LQKYFDNEELANLNQPLLETALRNWEKMIGRPIDNVETRYYGDYISRYGYKKKIGDGCGRLQKHDTEKKQLFA